MAALQIVMTLAYPGLVFVALKFVEPRDLALGLLVIFVARLALVSPTRLMAYATSLGLPALLVALALVVSVVWNDPLSLRLTPALVSFALLIGFTRSLARADSIIEAYARLQLGSLSEDESRYCRRVTALWCAFFLVNGAVASWLAVAGSLAEWALYTGCIAYVLIGALFASEFVYRQWRFRRYLGAPTDVIFRRIFPPPSP
jgi:uncharacterized membrane protein